MQTTKREGGVPAVSVVIAAYNAERFIDNALESCVRQTFADFEVLVVDDASTDSTCERVLQWSAMDPRIHLIRVDVNGGPGPARNLALARARGDWITILDADDWWHPERLASLLKAAAENGECSVVFDQFQTMIDTGQGAPRPFRVSNRAPGARFANKDSVEVSPSTLVKRDLGAQPFFSRAQLRRAGATFTQTARFGEDLAFLIELLSPPGTRLFQLCAPYYFYRVGLPSLTSRPTRVEDLEAVFDRLLAEGKISVELASAVRHRKARLADQRRDEKFKWAVLGREWRAAAQEVRGDPALLIRILTRLPVMLRYRLPLLWLRSKWRLQRRRTVTTSHERPEPSRSSES